MARELRGAVASLFDCRDAEVLVEGRAGTGKSIGVLTYLHDCARRYPGARIMVCRQHRATCTESVMVTWEEKVLGPTHPLVAGGPSRVNRHSHDYPNGSTVVWGGLDQPGKTFSTEWDLVYVNEATEITLAAWELFGRAMRNGRMPYQQRIADCNPDAPAHWLNRRAAQCDDALRLVRSPDDYARLQAYNEGEQRGPAPGVPPAMRRMVSVHMDNPAYFDLEAWRWTAVGERYLAQLDRMSGHRKQRMRDGLWVSAEGTVFAADFQEARHVIRPFAVPPEWPVYVGYDPGYDHPCAVLWFAVAPNGCYYVIDEVYGGGMGLQTVADAVHARNAGRTVRGYYGDPQNVNSKRQEAGGKSIAAQLRALDRNPLSFVGWPRTTDAPAMVEAVRKRLQEQTLKVFATCANTIDEFQSWRYKRNARGEPLTGDDQYEDANNHALDVIKGLVALNLGGAGGAVEVSGGGD